MSSSIPISAYVLAGGRSSRMGTDKALLQLAGKPLIQHAVEKLRRLTPNVQILSSNSALTPYAPLLADIHPHTGPIGGIEAALLHSTTDWNLFLAVDMPFLPINFIHTWLSHSLIPQNTPTRIHLIRVDDRPQPGLCLLHREVLPCLSQSIARGEYKLMHAFQTAAAEIATRTSVSPATILSITPLGLTQKACHSERSEEPPYFAFAATTFAPQPSDPARALTPQQQAAQHLWFTNLNTPSDFAEAAAHADALDT